MINFVDTARQFMNTEYIDNVRQKPNKIRRPDRHSFKAVQVLQIDLRIKANF